MSESVESFIERLPMDGLRRIDVGLEGSWNPSVTTVWTHEEGLVGFDRVERSHLKFKPSVELYFDDGWIGLHCFRREDGRNVFDEAMVLSIIRFVEGRLNVPSD